jgi:hypothetical protein
MSERLDATELQLRDVLPAEADAEVPRMGNIIAMPVRRGRLRIIQGGCRTSSDREGRPASEEGGFQASVLIGWAADGSPYLEVNCLAGQHLQTLMNAVMELEVLILEAQSKQKVSSCAPEFVELTSAEFSTPADAEKATLVEPTPPIPEQ